MISLMIFVADEVQDVATKGDLQEEDMVFYENADHQSRACLGGN